MTNYPEKIVDEIDQVLRKPNGKFNQTKMLWPHKELCNDIVSLTSFLPTENSLTTRVWYILNDKNTIRKCSVCGVEITDDIKSLYYSPSLTCSSKSCRDEARKRTLYSKYGPDYYQKWSSKVEDTNIKRYGSANAMDNPDIRVRQQVNAKAKVEACKEQILQKRMNTVQTRYGVENVGQLPDHSEKMRATSLNKYGAISYSCTSECKEKVKHFYSSWTPDMWADRVLRARSTLQERYGVTAAAAIPEVIRYRKSRYYYNNLYFDSSYELIYYIWAVDNGHKIERCTQTYSYEVDESTHYYIPDFVVDGELVEIKGEHFFNDKGELINPFTDDESIQRVFKAKGKLMESLRVNVIRNIDSMKEFVYSKYGSNYVSTFRVKLDK